MVVCEHISTAVNYNIFVEICLRALCNRTFRSNRKNYSWPKFSIPSNPVSSSTLGNMDVEKTTPFLIYLKLVPNCVRQKCMSSIVSFLRLSKVFGTIHIHFWKKSTWC